MSMSESYVSCNLCGAIFTGMALPSHACVSSGTLVPPAFSMPGYLPPMMTLRDYFAGQALAGMLSDPNFDPPTEKVAKGAYDMADAMLKAREAS